jgi:hypothetical protein
MKTFKSSLLSLALVSLIPVSFFILLNASLICSSLAEDKLYSLSILIYLKKINLIQRNF